jgi:WD40 repeat protein
MGNDKKSNFKTMEIFLPGKIAVSINDTCFIYDNADTVNKKFKIRNDSQIEYTYYGWLNEADSFIGIEYFKNPREHITQGNIVSFDLSGNIFDRIYESKYNEIAGAPSLSTYDSLLLFTIIKKGDVKQDPFAGFNADKIIIIMDFKKREIIRRIEGFTVDLEESHSPWIFGETHFLFTIPKDRKILLGNNRVNKPPVYKPGVYLYDLSTDQKTLVIPDATNAISCPVDKRFCYIKDQSVYVRDLKDNSEKILYTWNQGNIPHLNWSPDGKFIYMLCYDHNLHGSQEKLIESSTGKEIPFKKIHHGFYLYAWK